MAALVIRCRRCLREQTVKPQDTPGGITFQEAREIGWRNDSKGWMCPLCAAARAEKAQAS